MDKYSYVSNADVSFIDDLYQNYKKDPASVDLSWQKFFEGFEFSKNYAEGNGKTNGNGNGHTVAAAISASLASGNVDKEIKVRYLIHAYRTRAHLKSKTNPVRERK